MDGGHKGKGTDEGFRAVSRSKSQTRHDTIKTVINSFCMTSTLRSECEVYGLFKDLIPVEALENEVELERGRGRQGLLPDFKMEIPSPAGEPIQRLAELKIIGAVPKWWFSQEKESCGEKSSPTTS